MTVSFMGYFGSRHIGHDALHQAMAGFFGTTYFLSIAFGTLYVFTTAYVRGATFSERILASFANPFFWMAKEVVRLTGSHPFSESLYWFFNPLNIWLVSLMILEMGVATLVARAVMKRRGEKERIVTMAPLGVILGSLAFVIAAYAWGRGENLYVVFLKGYRFLFGFGVSF
jgi:hypothetical protein